MARVICHCWAIDKTLLTSQYRTRPAGKKKKNMLKAIGMIFMILACTGSGGSGFRYVWKIMVAPMSMGSTKYGSGADKSLIHNAKGACLNSTLASSTQ